MSHTPTLPTAILETVLTAIATLFLAGADNDAALARLAAKELLADYNPRTADELSLAATIISCSFRALDILVQATAKDLPTPQMLRLHASAIGLNREAAKAQRQLTQLQKERRHAETQPDPEPAPPPVQQPPARPLGPIAQFAKDRGLTWSQANKQREREKRIAASLERAKAKTVAADTAAAAAPDPAAPASP